MTFSLDLRERVVQFVEGGGSKTEAARRFGVSRWCVYSWLGRETLKPDRQGAPVGPRKISFDRLRVHVEQYPDAYQYERAKDLGVSRHVVMNGLKRLGIKKNVVVPREERQSS